MMLVGKLSLMDIVNKIGKLITWSSQCIIDFSSMKVEYVAATAASTRDW